MKVPEEYLDLDLYEVLKVPKDLDDSKLRKAYLRRALETHPDKGGDREEFEKVAFSWSVLSDKERRKHYDETGSIEEEDEVTIADLFSKYTRPDITEELIAEHRREYQGSKEEKADLIANYKKYKGNFDSVFESVIHSTIDDQQRLIDLLKEAINNGEIQSTPLFKKTTSKAALNRRSKEAGKEAKEAEEVGKKLGIDKITDEAGLAALIQSRQKNRFGNLISRLETKYKVEKPRKKKAI